MKNIVLPLAGLVVGAAIVIAVKSGGSAPANGADQSELERQNAELRKKLQAANQNSGRVEVIESTTEKVVFQTKAQTPEEIIAELRRIQPKADNRERAMREVIHYLTSLTKAGEPALTAIDKFLANNEDVEYEETALAFRRQQKAAEDARETGEEPRRNAADFVRSGLGSYFLAGAVEKLEREFTPQSMRIGLFFVLHDIGTAKAEAVLVRVLETTGRGAEVAYLDLILSQLAGEVYKDKVLEVVKDLLMNPVEGGTSLFDEASHMILFGLLTKYKDGTFIEEAKNRILTPDGRVDGAVVNYLSTLLGDKAVPLLYAKLQDDGVSNNGDRMALGDAVLRHVGTHPNSDAYFKEVITNEELGPFRFLALGHLVGGDTSKDTLRQRQKLITEIKADTEDEGLHRMLDGTHDRLDVMIDPSKAKEQENDPNSQNRGIEDLFNGLFNRGNRNKE